GPESELKKLKNFLSEFPSSEIHPSFTSDYQYSLFFTNIEDAFILRLNQVAGQILKPQAAEKKPARKTPAARPARSAFKPVMFVLALLLVSTAYAFYPYGFEHGGGEIAKESIVNRKQTLRIEPEEKQPADTISIKTEEPSAPEKEKPDPDETEEPPAPEKEKPEPDEKIDAVEPKQDITIPSARRSAFSRPLRIHFIDVGQGDAILIQPPNQKYYLIDAGKSSAADKVISYLNSLGVHRIEAVIMTHPHTDHIGGMTKIFEAFDVAEVWDAGAVHTTKTYEKTLEAIEKHGIRYRINSRGHQEQWGDQCRARVLHPGENERYNGLNDYSVTVLLQCGKTSALFPGDAEETAEAQMLEHHNLRRVDLLKVGHHGSGTSSTNKFLSRVSPDIGIISCGTDNSYGHPSSTTLQNLKRRRVDVYRTDLQGTIVATSRGRGFEIKTERQADGRSSGRRVTRIPTTPPARSTAKTSGQKININRASLDKLTEINGIGPALAGRIIKYRKRRGDFKNINDLKKVRGIGPNTINSIRDSVSVN
ncbi:MAG: helix-hairpin-helix domain-containing protein, partial [bacterium]